MRLELCSLQDGEVAIAKDSLLMAMGYSQGAPSPVGEIVDEVLETGGGLCRIQGGYKIIAPVQFSPNDFHLLVDDVTLDVHKVVFQQLKRASSVAVFVCTAGAGITDRSKTLMQNGDLLQGYVYDVFGSLVVEGAMDIIQGRLQKEMSQSGLKITNRYSPGYCGWDITEQRLLFRLLPGHFCGVELTESCLMTPTKSISGLIGIGENVKFNPYTCNLCDARNCLFKNLNQRTSARKNHKPQDKYQ